MLRPSSNHGTLRLLNDDDDFFKLFVSSFMHVFCTGNNCATKDNCPLNVEMDN